MYCFNCGTELPKNAKFCPKCGANMLNETTETSAEANVREVVKATKHSKDGANFTEHPKSTGFHYASFAKRVLASLIDQIIVAIIVCIPSALLSIVIVIAGAIAVGGGGDVESYLGEWFQLVYALLIIIGVWLYYTNLEASPQQATYGKRILGLVVTDLNGNRISKSQANTRMFGRLISNFLMGLPYLSALFNTKKQALHDSMSHTIVIEKK